MKTDENSEKHVQGKFRQHLTRPHRAEEIGEDKNRKARKVITDREAVLKEPHPRLVT